MLPNEIMDPKSKIRLDNLRSADSRLSDFLARAANKRTIDYLRDLGAPAGEARAVKRYRYSLFSSLRRAEATGHVVTSSRSALGDILLNGEVVLHTGGHCQSIYEPSIFRAWQCAYEIARLNANRPILIWQSAIVKLENSRKWGPGWINAGREPFNVFGLPRRVVGKLSPLAPISSSGLRRLVVRGETNEEASPQSAWKARIGEIASHLGDGETAEATVFADIILSWNAETFASMTKNAVPFAIFDERALATIIADLLEQGETSLCTLLFDPQTRREALDYATRMKGHPGFRWPTDFFWENDKGAIRPMRSVGLAFENFRGERTDVEDLVAKLRSHELLPGIFLGYLVFAILPQLRALGGPIQLSYFPRYLDLAHQLGTAGEPDALPQAFTTMLIEQGVHRLKTWEPDAFQSDLESFEALSLEVATAHFRGLGLMPAAISNH